MPTRAEALAILDGAPPRYRAAIAPGLTGLRVGEVLGMAPDRVNLERRQVTVDQQLQRVGGGLVLTTPKAAKVRTITVPASSPSSSAGTSGTTRVMGCCSAGGAARR